MRRTTVTVKWPIEGGAEVEQIYVTNDTHFTADTQQGSVRIYSPDKVPIAAGNWGRITLQAI